jgi:hypothetical protein
LASRLHALQHLNLNHLLRLTDASVERVVDGLRDLRSLDISQCSKLSAAALEHALNRLALLSEVHLRACLQFDDACVVRLARTTNALNGVLGQLDLRDTGVDAARCLQLLKTDDWGWEERDRCFFR